MPVTVADVAAEFNAVAEYAGIPGEFAPAPDGSDAVTFLGETFPVEPSWAVGNARRLPDRTDVVQVVEALRASAPGVRGVGPKSPPRA